MVEKFNECLFWLGAMCTASFGSWIIWVTVREFDMICTHPRGHALGSHRESDANEPTHYCGAFLEKNPETAENLSSFAVELARSWFGAEDEGEIMVQTTCCRPSCL